MNRRSFIKISAVLAGAGVSGIGLKELLRKRIVMDLRKAKCNNPWEYLGLREDCMIFASLSESCDGTHVKIIDWNGSVFYETGQQS